MRIRASRATIIRATALLTALGAGAGCTHASGKLMVDVPKMLPYQAPDIDEITGIDSDAEEDTGTHAGSAQNPHK
jgi:hypothetical protein